MAAKTVNKYRVFCNTEAEYVFVWADQVPTACPHNQADAIDASTISIVDTVQSAAVRVLQETGPTGGHYCCESHSFTAAAGTSTSSSFSYPYPISVSGVSFYAAAEMQGDAVVSQVAPDTPIGVLTADVAAGDSVLNVSASAAANAVIGTLVGLSDGANAVGMGRAVAIDAVNGRITCSLPAAASFAAAAPTAVLMTFQNINVTISQPGKYAFGSRSLAAAYIPAGTRIAVTYTNAGATDKPFVHYIEFLY